VVEERPQIAPVESVREELRRLGYLDSGLDRFVLGGAGTRSTTRALVAVAWRVGLAGGVVFGIALSLLAASLEPRSLAHPLDVAVLAAYVCTVLGVATGVAAAAGGLLTRVVSDRLGKRAGPNASRGFGLLLGLAGILYLALWWRSHAALAPLPLQIAFVVIGVLLAAVLGRFGSLAAVAVLSAAGGVQQLPAASLTRRHMLPLSTTAVLLFGGGLAAATYLQPSAETAPDYAVVPTGLRVRIVAIDGLERRMAERMLGRGEMPNLAELIAKGASAALLPEPEQVPAIVWTTIATGRGPDAHGIRSAGERRLAGMTTPVPLGASEGSFGKALARATELLQVARTEPASAPLRGAKTFWNVASEKGLRIGIVNWWASWPAEQVSGYLVSERAFFKLQRRGPADREVHPPEAFSRLRELVGPADEERAKKLDRFHARAAGLLRRDAPPDLEAVYLNGLDVFTESRLAQSGGDVADLDARVEEVRAQHAFVDTLIGELLARRMPSDVAVIVGDPGRFARRTAEKPEGLLVLAGGPVIAGRTLGTAFERDIAPTVLHLLGVPVSREIEGRVLLAALAPEFAAKHPLREVASYGRRPPTRERGSDFDREMVEELRALGYIR
jgi:hypothetical protein